MEELEKEVLRLNRTEIIKDLEPKDILMQLYQDDILTENDLELISEGRNRRERCQLLLSMLPRCGPQAYGSFKQALAQDGYSHISDILKVPHEQSESKITDSVKIRCNGSSETEVNNGETHAEETKHDILHKNSKRNETATLETDDIKSCTCSELLPQLGKDTKFNKLIEDHCCLLMDNIEPRDITDYPYQEHLLTDDECERIHSGVTRKDRCQLLLQILAGKTAEQQPVPILLQALSKKYAYIVQICDKHLSGTADFKGVNTCNKVGKDPSKNANLHGNGITAKEPICTEEGDGSSYIHACPPVPQKTKQTKYTKHDRNNRRKNQTNEISSKDFSITTNKQRINRHIQRMKHKQAGKEINKYDQENIEEDIDKHQNIVLFKNPAMASTPNKLPNKKLALTFNHLSSLINQGNYDKFETLSAQLGHRFQGDADMKCLLSYLQASRYLYGNNLDAAKESIDTAMDVVPMTTNPKYFTVELYTAKTRMYITQKKLNKLDNALTDIKQVIESDPVGCTGRAAGWLYMNDGRNKTAQMMMINLQNGSSALSAYNKLFTQAKESFTRALINFERDGGKDGPFGVGYAVCRLTILLLRCGDNGLTMNTVVPSAEDIQVAGGYIQHLEDSDIPISKILSLHYSLAKCDYQYRKGNMVRASEHASDALNVATDINLQEFIEHAHNRVLALSMCNKSQQSVLEDVADAEEFQKLLENSSDSESAAS